MHKIKFYCNSTAFTHVFSIRMKTIPYLNKTDDGHHYLVYCPICGTRIYIGILDSDPKPKINLTNLPSGSIIKV